MKTKFIGLERKTDNYLIDDGSEDKKAKGTKECVIKKNWKVKKSFRGNTTSK